MLMHCVLLGRVVYVFRLLTLLKFGSGYLGGRLFGTSCLFAFYFEKVAVACSHGQ